MTLRLGPMIWKNMRRNVWKGAANWQTRKSSSDRKSLSTPCLHDHQFKKEDSENCRGTYQKKSSHIVLEWGRTDILWCVNYMARAITKLARLISYNHFTSGYRQSCHVENTASECRLGLFQNVDFEGDLTDSKSTSGGVVCILGSNTSVPISCKKHTSCCTQQQH